MVAIKIRTRDGVAHDISAREGLSLMENIRDAGFEELIAMCGGCLSCATCHVYVEHAPEGTHLPAMSGDEDALLDGLDFRKPTSRLSCQIKVSTAIQGLGLAIAPEE